MTHSKYSLSSFFKRLQPSLWNMVIGAGLLITLSAESASYPIRFTGKDKEVLPPIDLGSGPYSVPFDMPTELRARILGNNMHLSWIDNARGEVTYEISVRYEDGTGRLLGYTAPDAESFEIPIKGGFSGTLHFEVFARAYNAVSPIAEVSVIIPKQPR